MSKFNVHVEQDNRTVSLWFSGEFPARWRGQMCLFEASNGLLVYSVNFPELHIDGDIFTPGITTYKDQHTDSVRCGSFEEATVLYNKVVDALIEWSESGNKKS
jgi:hypothetical protein